MIIRQSDQLIVLPYWPLVRSMRHCFRYRLCLTIFLLILRQSSPLRCCPLDGRRSTDSTGTKAFLHCTILPSPAALCSSTSKGLIVQRRVKCAPQLTMFTRTSQINSCSVPDKSGHQHRLTSTRCPMWPVVVLDCRPSSETIWFHLDN